MSTSNSQKIKAVLTKAPPSPARSTDSSATDKTAQETPPPSPTHGATSTTSEILATPEKHHTPDNHVLVHSPSYKRRKLENERGERGYHKSKRPENYTDDGFEDERISKLKFAREPEGEQVLHTTTEAILYELTDKGIWTEKGRGRVRFLKCLDEGYYNYNTVSMIMLSSSNILETLMDQLPTVSQATSKKKKSYYWVEGHDYTFGRSRVRTLAIKYGSEKNALDWKRWFEIAKNKNCGVRRGQHPVDKISLDFEKLSTNDNSEEEENDHPE